MPLKAFLRLDNISNELLDKIISPDEIEEEAKYRVNLAKFKWAEYLKDGSEQPNQNQNQNQNQNENQNQNQELSRPEKPEDPHLKVTKKMKYMNWNTLRLMNIDKFNLKNCSKCDKKTHLTLYHIMDKHLEPTDDRPQFHKPIDNFIKIMDLSRCIANVEQQLVNNTNESSIINQEDQAGNTRTQSED